MATLMTLGALADLSDSLQFAVIAVPAVLIIGLVPSLAQLWFMGSDTRRAIEAFNAFNLLEQQAYVRVTGRKPPRLLTAGRVRRWLDTGGGAGTPLRAHLLLWVGDLDAADAAIGALPADNSADALQRELLSQEHAFVSGGAMDLSTARTLLERIPDGPDRERGALGLAFQEARSSLARGQSWQPPLVAARSALHALPPGATIRDRVIASLPMSLLPVVVVVVMAWITTH